MSFSPDRLSRSPAPPTTDVFTVLAGVLHRHTGQAVALDDLDVDLHRDLRLDAGTLGVVLVDAASALCGSRELPRLTPQQFHSLRSLCDVVALFRRMAVVGPRQKEALEFADTDFPMPIEIVEGTPAEMGRQYGRSQGENIRRYVEWNIELFGLAKLQVMPELLEAIGNPTLYFGPSELEELSAMSEAAGLTPEYLIGHNLSLYPEYVPGCSQFAISAHRNSEFGLVQGVNEDSPISLRMRELLIRVMTVRRPAGGIPHLTFAITGQIGGLNGVNAAGLIVTTTLLLDRPRRPGTEHGWIHPVLVKRILEAASSIEEALDVLRGCTRNGAWSLCLTHAPSDRICYVEYDGAKLEVIDHLESLVTTNHCLLHSPLVAPPSHSVNRLTRLSSLLNLDSNRGLSPSWAKTILRDRYDLSRMRQTPFPTMHTVRRVDNQGSFVFVPAAGELWVTAGPMAPHRADTYFRISLDRLFRGGSARVTDPASRMTAAV